MAASPILGLDARPIDGEDRPVNLAYELPLTFVDSYLGIVHEMEIITGGLLPILGWHAGLADPEAPAHWLGAVNTAKRLTTTGTPSAAYTPYQLEDGAAVPSEQYDGTEKREYTTAGVDPGLTDDVVAIFAGRFLHNAAINDTVLGTRRSDRGWMFYLTGAYPRLVFYVRGNTAITALGPPIDVGGKRCIAIGVCQRGGNTQMWINGQTDGPLVTPAGTIASGEGISVGGRTDLLLYYAHADIDLAIAYYGIGIAAPILANSAAFVVYLNRLIAGAERRTGPAGPVFARDTAASWQDRNGRHTIASCNLPRCGDRLAGGESGCRMAPARTNKCYENINTTVAGAALWTVDDASAVGRIDDSVALAAAAEPAEVWGPYVCRYANATGANRYMWIPGSTGNVNVHAIQVMARIVAGAGAQLGWWSIGGAAFTFAANITSGYLRTIANNLTPPAADCRLCLMLPNGCEVRWIAHQVEEAVTATSPIPNWSTVAGAARAAEVITLPVPPVDGQGAIELGITPMGWTAGVTGQDFVVSRAGVADQMLYYTAGDRWATYDGTTVCQEGAGTAADGVRQVLRATWLGGHQTLRVDGVEVAAVYAGARMGGGNIAIYSISREWAVDSVKLFRRPPP